jgi:hypothetical protein
MYEGDGLSIRRYQVVPSARYVARRLKAENSIGQRVPLVVIKQQPAI